MEKLTFKLPAGFQLPEGVSEKGDEFDAIAKIRLGDDGKVELVALDRAPLSEEADEDAGFRESVMSNYE